jgi:hypothetical protein
MIMQAADTFRTKGNKANEEKGLGPKCMVWGLHQPGDRHSRNPALVTTSFFVTFVSFCSQQLPDQG